MSVVCETPVRFPLASRVRFLAILRGTTLYCGTWLLLMPPALAIAVGHAASSEINALVWAGIVVFGTGMSLSLRSPRVDEVKPLVVAPPVRGTWGALNSPASRVPSHGTHAYGQTYAIDLIYFPNAQSEPALNRTNAMFLAPDDFASFAKPVYAVADGIIIHVRDRQRDHKSRSSKIALAYFFLEAFARSLGPPSFVLGNYLILRLQDGSHMLYAHLRQGSLRVSPGSRVLAGEVIAECGNSGNSTMPHLHIQRQDSSSVLSATGLPWAIAEAGEAAEHCLPRNGQIARFN